MKRCIQLLLCILCLSLYMGCATSQHDDDTFSDSPDSSQDDSDSKNSSSNKDNFSEGDIAADANNSSGSDGLEELDKLNESQQSSNKNKSGSKDNVDKKDAIDDFSQNENDMMADNNSQAPRTDAEPLLEEDLAAQDKELAKNKKDTKDDLPPPTDDFISANTEPKNGDKKEADHSKLQDKQNTNLEAQNDSISPVAPSAPNAPSAPSSAIGSAGESSGQIKNIRFEGNDAGGTVVVEGNQPLVFTSRFNDQTKQFVIEVTNVNLPNALKRPYVTKDFQGNVGSIDAYQSPGSDTARIVVQLKDGATEPTIQQEGNNILIVSGGAAGGGAGNVAQNANGENGDAGQGDANSNPNDDSSFINNKGILSSANLQQFLSSNMKFYGKKISLEMKDISVREAINLIAEESGANLIMTESVSGNLSLKLRQVPWDQALIMVLRAKKLGYTRQGNILRITELTDIRKEEDDALKFAESKRKVDPLIVQLIPINYAKIDDLKGQVSTILSERGKAVADNRTNALIVTDTEDVLERVKKMVAGLDIAPAQVLIEGKIVEARESFEKKIGIQWDLFGQDVALGSNKNGPSNMTPTLTVHPGINQGSSLGFNLRIGNIDLLGDLSTMLALEEREDNVKVISSPRIVTLHNEQATISQSSQIPIIEGSGAGTTGSVFGAAQRTRNVTFKNITMNLSVTPHVANNGNVILTVDMKREFPGAVTDEASGAAPIHSRDAKTKVMVKNGQTAVIGGIYQNDARNGESGVPYLKDIPILGYLFRSENHSKDKTELLLFLTPRILSQTGSTQVSTKELSNLEVQ